MYIKQDPYANICTYMYASVWVYTCIMIIVLLFSQAGGGRNEVDPRFISLFSVYNITFPSPEALFHIYHSILQGHLQPFKKCMRMLKHYVKYIMFGCTVGYFKVEVDFQFIRDQQRFFKLHIINYNVQCYNNLF